MYSLCQAQLNNNNNNNNKLTNIREIPLREHPSLQRFIIIGERGPGLISAAFHFSTLATYEMVETQPNSVHYKFIIMHLC